MTSKKDFERILERYLNGTASEQEVKWVEKWYASLDSKDDLLSDKLDEQILHQQDWESIQNRIRKKNNNVFLHWPSLAAAAAVLIIGLVLIYSLDPTPTRTHTSKNVIASTNQEIVNESSEVKIFTLP